MKKIKESVNLLLQTFPETYSEELGIKLKSKKESEFFKWFLASILFGARISETIAKNTYKAFVRHKILTPRDIRKASWHEMIDIMGEGGYVRYDGKTTNTLWGIAKRFLEDYDGKVSNLYKVSKDTKDLEEKLEEFKGIGPITVNIFLRELRGIWKVDPLPSRFTIIAANNLKLIKTKEPRKALKRLKEVWRRNKVKGKTFANFETALLRLGKDYCDKNKCKICSLKKICPLKKKGL